ncbi:Uncharacterized protein GBIM_07878 [Gryllus bimaculatus]|nr:Uncharacterized protein GBIM_07878 [Gryllus bimaculatus]
MVSASFGCLRMTRHILATSFPVACRLSSLSFPAARGSPLTEPPATRGYVEVSWIRRKDYRLLTVGLATYSSDDRFFTAHVRGPQDWALHVRFAQAQDAGLYECQVSTHPPASLFTELQLVELDATGEREQCGWRRRRGVGSSAGGEKLLERAVLVRPVVLVSIVDWRKVAFC